MLYVHLVANSLVSRPASGLRPLLPCFHNLPDRFLQTLGDIPTGVVSFHFPKVAVVADMVSDAVLIDVGVLLFLASEFLGDREGLEDGAGVLLTPAEVVDLCYTRCLDERCHEAGDIERVDVIADLLPLVAEDAVLFALEVAFNEVAEESVQLDAGVVGAGEAAPAQGAGGHTEVAAVFLNHDVGGDLGGSEEGVLALVDGEVLCNAMGVGGIGVVPAGLQFLECDAIGAVAVDLVRGHMDEGGLGTSLSRGLQHVERADGIRIKVIKGDGCGAIMAGLGRCVDDCIGLYFGHQVEDTLSVADIQFVVDEALQLALEALLVPAGVALGTEEDGALVVINSVNLVPELFGEVMTHLGANEARGAGDEEFFGHKGRGF